jgi:hypothetical protein
METLSTLATVTALCNVLGGVMKRVPAFPDWCIPAALTLVVGPIATVALAGASAENVVEGVLAGAASVGLHQGFTNAVNRGK